METAKRDANSRVFIHDSVYSDRATFGRSPRPGKWKNIRELTEDDVKSFRREQSQEKLTA